MVHIQGVNFQFQINAICMLCAVKRQHQKLPHNQSMLKKHQNVIKPKKMEQNWASKKRRVLNFMGWFGLCFARSPEKIKSPTFSWYFAQYFLERSSYNSLENLSSEKALCSQATAFSQWADLPPSVEMLRRKAQGTSEEHHSPPTLGPYRHLMRVWMRVA